MPNKLDIIGFRIESKTKEDIQQLCKEKQISLSEFLTKKIKEEVEFEKKKLQKAEAKDVFKLKNDLRKKLMELPDNYPNKKSHVTESILDALAAAINL